MLELSLIQNCSPSIDPIIVNAIVKTESNYNPFAIGINRGTRLARQPKNFNEAVQTAKNLLAQGANIDLGYAQINSSNLNWLGLSVEQVFQPCANLKAMQTVYYHCFDRAGNTGLGTRMQRAFSCYNTGSFTKGFKNGYVAKATNNLNNLAAKVTNASQYLPQPTYAVKNGSIIAVDDVQINSASQVPDSVQNANMSVSVRSDDGNLTQPQDPKNIQADDTPIKVYHSWDIFGDF